MRRAERHAGLGHPGAAAGAAQAGPISADLFSGEVKITADKNTNSLVVIASQADYRNLVKVVERLDIRRRQVFVEAVIMEVNLENDLDVGVSAHGGTILFVGTKKQAQEAIAADILRSQGREGDVGGRILPNARTFSSSTAEELISFILKANLNALSSRA